MANGDTPTPTNGKSGAVAYLSQATQVVRDVGFPVVVASILLYLLAMRIPELRDSFKDLQLAVLHLAEQQKELIDKCGGS